MFLVCWNLGTSVFCFFFFFFFFFQAEDGIRDTSVTGVQTCVFRSPAAAPAWPRRPRSIFRLGTQIARRRAARCGFPGRRSISSCAVATAQRRGLRRQFGPTPANSGANSLLTFHSARHLPSLLPTGKGGRKSPGE